MSGEKQTNIGLKKETEARRNRSAPLCARASQGEETMIELIALVLFSQQPIPAMIEGKASYYSVDSSSNRTASGELFRDDEFTCAMNTGEFGDRVLVVSDSGRSVVCRINDRGPFVKHRVIDLSKAAMHKLDPGLRRGVINVRVYPLGPGFPNPPTN
jgi:rare lipoprotein A